jgi:MFS transporter, ACS family, glucarate transporter
LVERRTRVRFLLAFWLFVLSAVSFLDRTNVSIAGIQISKDFGLGNQQLGWVFSAFLVGYALCQVPAGWLAAKYGPRRVIAIGVMWWGVATALTALLPQGIPHAVMLLVAVRFGLGAGEAVMYPAASQFVARWIPLRERGSINGLIFAGVGAGSGLTPPLLAWLIAAHGWRASFWFSAIVGFVAALVWWWIARDAPEQHPRVSSGELEEIRTGIGEGGAVGEGGAIPWRAILGRGDLYALIAAYFSFGYVAWIYFSWFFVYMAQVRGLDPKASARFTMLPFLSMTLCCLGGGVLSDRLTRLYGLRVGRCWLAAGALVLAAAFVIVGSQVHGAQLAGVILAAGAGVLYLSQSSFWSASVDIAGRSSGVFSSLVNIGAQLGGAVTASLTPWVAQRFGWESSFAIAAVLAVLGAGCWMTVRPEQSLEV